MRGFYCLRFEVLRRPIESKDLVVPYEDMPPALKKSMSGRWRQKVRN
jgi:hypothetical protein